MHGFVLQPWLTVKGTTTLTTLTQSEAGYLDLAPFEDYVAWIEVDELTATGVTTPTLWLETAPLKEEALFAPTGASQTSVTLAIGVTTVKNILNAQVATQIPLARFLRWRIEMTGASAIWSATFQVHVAAHSLCLPVVA